MQFAYELIPQHSYGQQKMCWAIAVDFDNTFLVTGAESNINVFQFKKGTIKKIQTIQKHQSWITTLNFFKYLPFFISGSSSVKMWSKNLQSNPKFLLKLAEHSSNISCLVIRDLNPSIIISGSKDITIKFWYQKELQWTCVQTIREHLNAVSGLSLNEEGNCLVSCGEDNQIIITKNIEDHKWRVVQKIQIQGVRLQFISKETFAFQPWQSNKLELYSFEPQTGFYQKNKEFEISGCRQFCTFSFPCIYIPSKCILLSKNGYNLNIIRLNITSSNIEGRLEQAIDFDYPNNWLGNIFGTMSENGDFLITWDSKSKQIQIRQYQEKEINQLQQKVKNQNNCCLI